MGIIVHDTIEVPGVGVSLADISMTCGGSYDLRKLENNVYCIYANIQWKKTINHMPMYRELVTILLTEEEMNNTTNMLQKIYNTIKLRYISTEDN